MKPSARASTAIDRLRAFGATGVERIGPYALAAGAVALAYAVRVELLDPLFGDRIVFITFYPAVILTAVLGGFRAGCLATVLSTMACAFLLLPEDVRHLGITTPDGAGLVVFTAMGVFVSGVVGLYRSAQYRLRATERRFRTLANNIAHLAWIADERGRPEWFNDRWVQFTGNRSADAGAWMDVIDPEHRDRVSRTVRSAVEAGREWEEVFPMRGHEGKQRWFVGHGVPVRDEHGRVVQWFGTATDVTDQRQAVDSLQEAARRKDEFLAMLSHELRNPLTPIRTGAWSWNVPGREANRPHVRSPRSSGRRTT